MCENFVPFVLEEHSHLPAHMQRSLIDNRDASIPFTRHNVLMWKYYAFRALFFTLIDLRLMYATTICCEDCIHLIKNLRHCPDLNFLSDAQHVPKRFTISYSLYLLLHVFLLLLLQVLTRLCNIITYSRKPHAVCLKLVMSHSFIHNTMNT